MDHIRCYIWRKWVTPQWLESNEPAIDDCTGGTHVVIERPGRARIGLEFFSDSLRGARALAETFGGSVIRLPVDWEARCFESHKTKPLRVGRRLVVRSDPGPGETIPGLVIPAGAAFGTGEHVTTAMSLRLLERVTLKQSPGWRMLDAGTGSGILALAGRRFGAGEVVAVDNDPQAIRTARENARRNRIRKIKFVVADVTMCACGSFDIIAANLYSELLAAVLARFRSCLRNDGRLILSGVLREQESRFQRALRANGFRVETIRRRGKWTALLCRGIS